MRTIHQKFAHFVKGTCGSYKTRGPFPKQHLLFLDNLKKMNTYLFNLETYLMYRTFTCILEDSFEQVLLVFPTLLFLDFLILDIFLENLYKSTNIYTWDWTRSRRRCPEDEFCLVPKIFMTEISVPKSHGTGRDGRENYIAQPTSGGGKSCPLSKIIKWTIDYSFFLILLHFSWKNLILPLFINLVLYFSQCRSFASLVQLTTNLNILSFCIYSSYILN